MRNKQVIGFVCSKCGKDPKKNEKESTDEWTVIDNKPCVHCGGKLIFEVDLSRGKKALKL